jgi:dinuclear metal center YbgI/SA1388 family protein
VPDTSTNDWQSDFIRDAQICTTRWTRGVTELSAGAVTRDDLTRELNEFLAIRRFKDAAVNGLQVAGRERVAHILVGVTANKPLIDAAINANADAIIVHHGLFWRGDDPRLMGYHRERVAALLATNINLYAYHLPLDAHAEVGNNACLGRRLNLTPLGVTGELGLVMLGTLGANVAVRCVVLAAYVARHYGRRVTLFTHPERLIRKIAWCTGAGGSLLGDAIEAGADAYITGEISEQHVHQARESNITLITAGHHATERDGVAALAAHVVKRFGVTYQFIDINSPV